MFRSCWFAWSLVAMAALPLAADEKPRVAILLDTDLGAQADDAYALALAVADPRIELAGVTTISGDTSIRAKMVCRFLHAVGKEKIPVAAGSPPQPKGEIGGQYQYYYHPAVLYGRAGKPVAQDAVERMRQLLEERPGEITIVATGPLTNVARLLKEHPTSARKAQAIVVMGGSIERSYEGKREPVAESNFAADVEAARAVLGSGIPLRLVPLDATWNLKVDRDARAKLLARKSMLTLQVEALEQMENRSPATLFDVLAVAAAGDEGLCTWEEMALVIDDQGRVQRHEEGNKVRVATASRGDDVLVHLERQLTAWGETSLPREPKNETRLITDERFPARVHVVEDYETDIEQRWWLAGRLETENVPSGSRRAFRSQLTLDFDDLQGQLDTMYSAVVFNPVPGPPMGPRTRLKFRYFLAGTDTLRVQIYSLSNGYHRYLSLKGLPQGKWGTATVDMTAARRPDGSGGALSEDERIDDVQFYVDPRASVLIDDIVLYDAAEDEEMRPFPRRIVFTGWFDTGKQGAEWPGEFAIVEHEKPRTWKFARSIEKEGMPVLRVGLRGLRPVGKTVRLQFDYLLDSREDVPLRVMLANKEKGARAEATLERPKRAAWQRGEVEFMLPEASEVDTLDFDVPRGATLSIDNVLLYEE